MSWTDEDVKRIQAKYGDNATVTLEDGETLNVKVNEKAVDRQQFLDGWMAMVKEQNTTVGAVFTVVMQEGQDLEIVKAAAEKNGLQLHPVYSDEGHHEGRYQITLKA